MTQMLELEEDFKAAVVTMPKDRKENMLIIKEQIRSPKSSYITNYIKYKWIKPFSLEIADIVDWIKKQDPTMCSL